MVPRFPCPDDREQHDLKVERRVMLTIVVQTLVPRGNGSALTGSTAS
jgi:hypothetical protein